MPNDVTLGSLASYITHCFEDKSSNIWRVEEQTMPKEQHLLCNDTLSMQIASLRLCLWGDCIPVGAFLEEKITNQKRWIFYGTWVTLPTCQKMCPLLEFFLN